VGSARPFEQVVSDSLRSRRFVLTLVAVLGGAALLLAGIGLFGVTSYLVAQRTSEIGVRLVLGAQPRDVLRLVALGGMRLVGAGLALGLLGGLLLARVFESELFGVRAWDPVAMAGVAASLAFVALVSLAVPAWRAATIAPARAMRVE
jgi:putative ABC transport system permease protein